jgi:EF hand
MNVRMLLGVAGALTLAGVAVAGAKEVRIERSHTCVCTGEPGVAPVPPVPPIPPIPPGAHWQMELQDSDAPNVYMFRQDGDDDEQVVVIRRHDRHDSADENNDGKVTRREFMRRAEKHFKERDKNGDGKLDGKELGPKNFNFPMPPPPPPAPPAPHEDD